MIFTNYLTVNEQDTAWGLTINTVGYQEVAPHSVYPPRDRNHPKKHMFNPEKGRILDEYQLIYIVDGSGTFEAASCGKTQIKAGDVFLLFPGEWHTYSPNKETGWKEYWIGFKGYNMDDRVQSGFFKKEHPVYNIGFNDTIINLYNNAITIAYEQKKHFQQQVMTPLPHQQTLTFSFYHDLTAPTITPFTKYFCKNGYTTNIGVIMITTKVIRKESGVTVWTIAWSST